MAQAEIITIGNELLIGRTLDTNANAIGKALNGIGITTRRITSIADEASHLVQALKAALAESQVVILTGGLGPTKDDLTKHVLASFFDAELIVHEPTLQHITAFFQKRGRELTELNRRQALVPDKATTLFNALGTAPGMQFATSDGKVVFSLPGVPHEMLGLLRGQVVPYLTQHYSTELIIQHTLHTAAVPESLLAQRLADYEDALPPEYFLAYNAGIMTVDLRLSVRAPKDKAADIRHDFDTRLQELRSLLGRDVYGEENETQESAVGKLLLAQGRTLALAESCTGGSLQASLLAAPGASQYILGGVVAYSNALKQQLLQVPAAMLAEHGAVSEHTAIAMAQGALALTGADVALSTTGIAGPEGGSELKPVGTVWIGYADKQKAFAKHYLFEQHRQRNIQRTVVVALELLRRELLKH